MGPLVVLVIVAAILVVLGFVGSGVLLGLGTLGRDVKRLFWPELSPEERGR